MFYEMIKCALISLQQHHVKNTSKIKKSVEEPTRWACFEVDTEWLNQCVVEIINSAQVQAAHRYGKPEAKFHWM